MSYEVGSLYRSTCTVRDAAGALVSPATKVLTVTLPDQTSATPVVATDGTGQFHVDYQLALEGLHKFTWVTTGPNTARSDYANASVFRSIVGIDEVRDFINDTDTTRDATLRQIMAAATELAESIAGSCVQRTYVNERIPGYEKQVIRLGHGPLTGDTSITSITSVWPGGPSWSASGLITYPDSATCEPANLIPFYYGPWVATYSAGRLVIPERIQLAVKEIIYDMWSSQRPYGADSLEPGPEDTARVEQMIAGYEIPPHARLMLEKEAMPGFA